MEKKRLKLPNKVHLLIMRFLRKAFSWSGLMTEPYTKQRVSRGIYQCEKCGLEGKKREFHLDHIDPCVDVEDNPNIGYDYHGIINRMFNKDNLMVLCKGCHYIKTGEENKVRRIWKKKS